MERDWKNLKVVLCNILILLTVVSFLVAPSAKNVKSQTAATGANENVNVLSESSGSRIAPGEFLPISVKLVNFGSEKRTDVVVNYKIFNNADKDVHLQKEIYSESETVAVETTASFVKRIQLPYNLKPGLYRLVTVVNYPYQEEPAVSRVPFLVEEKIGGIFKSDLKVYSIFFIVAVSVAVIIALLLIYTSVRKRKGWGAMGMYDYSDKPKNQIVYYEILSNVVFQTRLRIGDKAIKIANEIPDLSVDEKTGKVLNIKGEPAKIISTLIARYEELLGHPLSFGVARK